MVLKSKQHSQCENVKEVWHGNKTYILFSDTQEEQREIRFRICNKKEISFFKICNLSPVFKKMSPFILIFSLWTLLAICSNIYSHFQ